MSDKVEDVQQLGKDVLDDATEVAEDVASSAEDTAKAVEEKTVDLVEDAEIVEDDKPEEAPAEEPQVDEEVLKESTPSDYSSPPAPAVVPPQTIQKVGFVPMVLGGLLAGGIGYFVATLNNGSDLSAEVAAQEAQIATQAETIGELRDALNALASSDTVTSLEDAVGANGEQIAALGERIDSAVTDLTDRVDVLERQPSADGTLQETAIAAFESDMTALRDQVVAQQEELENMINATREEAQAIESSAIASARAATARASLAVIQGSLESGAPFGAALNDLAGSLQEPVPAALESVAETGVPTLATIQDEYPDAARAALAAARQEGASGEGSEGVMAFFRDQFDVRSVAPKEGDSVDAILSRTDAALKEGRLNDALAEAASLPEVARGALADWTGLAETRAAALDAAMTLASQLNVN